MTCINKAFCTPAISNQSLLPTQDALWLYIAIANYQAAIHKRALQKFIKPSDHLLHGRQSAEDGKLQINWMSQKPAADDVLQMIIALANHQNCIEEMLMQNSPASMYWFV